MPYSDLSLFFDSLICQKGIFSTLDWFYNVVLKINNGTKIFGYV